MEVAEFAKFGPTWMVIGIIITGLTSALVVLWRHNNKLQEKIYHVQNTRLELMREFNKELLDISEEHNHAIANLTTAVASLKDVILSRR